MIASPPSGVATESVLSDGFPAGRGDLAHHLVRRTGVGTVAA